MAIGVKLCCCGDECGTIIPETFLDYSFGLPFPYTDEEDVAPAPKRRLVMMVRGGQAFNCTLGASCDIAGPGSPMECLYNLLKVNSLLNETWEDFESSIFQCIDVSNREGQFLLESNDDGTTFTRTPGSGGRIGATVTARFSSTQFESLTFGVNIRWYRKPIDITFEDGDDFARYVWNEELKRYLIADSSCVTLLTETPGCGGTPPTCLQIGDDPVRYRRRMRFQIVDARRIVSLGDCVDGAPVVCDPVCYNINATVTGMTCCAIAGCSCSTTSRLGRFVGLSGYTGVHFDRWHLPKISSGIGNCADAGPCTPFPFTFTFGGASTPFAIRTDCTAGGPGFTRWDLIADRDVSVHDPMDIDDYEFFGGTCGATTLDAVSETISAC